MSRKDNCADYKKLISAYIDNETSQKETAFLSSHLLECSQCKRELANLYTVRDMVKSCYTPKGEVDFSSDIMAKIRYSKSGTKSSSSKRLSAKAYGYGIVAALLLLAISSTVFYSQSRYNNMMAEKRKFDTYMVEHINQQSGETGAALATASVISTNFEK
ncbi:MAG: zf-HC2 domain-containing protein [Deferribacterales bacterium]|nr:zf-HC2 domain-containing protein [Deferribacterales bacterium]